MLPPMLKNALLNTVMLFIFLTGLKAQIPDWSNYKDIKEQLTAMNKYGRTCIIKQQYDQALDVFKSAALVAQQSSLDSFRARCLLNTGLTYRYKSVFDSAIIYFNQALKVAESKNYFDVQAAVQLEFFNIYNITGKTDSANARINMVQSMVTKLDTIGSERAKLELYLGHLTKRETKYSQAFTHYFKALNIFNYLKDSTNIAVTYISIANVFNNRGEQDKALGYFREAVAILTKLNRKYELANALLNMTDDYYYLNKLDSAEITDLQALALSKELNQKAYMGYAYMHLGYINKLRKQFSNAKNYFQQSIRLAEELGSESLLYGDYQGMGETYMAEQEPAKAKVYLEKHLAIVKKINNIEEIIEAYADLKENEYNLHNYAKAHEYEKLYAIYKDSAYNESVTRNMADIESKYENQKKEQEIILLKKDQELQNIELQKARTTKLSAIILSGLLLIIGLLVVNRYRVIQKARQMVEIEKLRNNIARDLHDDIGSVLSSININSNVALSNAGEERIVKGQLEKIKEHSGRMMEGMSDIVWAINPINDSLDKMIIRMKEFAVEILEPQNINFSFKTEGNVTEAALDISRRKELYLIFKEAINNAAKYSGCKNIAINLGTNRNRIQLKISDDGKGFDKNLIKSGNGLHNMEQRAVAIGGSIEIFSTMGKGTELNLEIPIA
ncbi:MAG: tetratricopeptide repeat protein [Bacteroidetes bacterium]|nr:tetratricopeptide repeat protein [Bacteroidota bacterium]